MKTLTFSRRTPMPVSTAAFSLLPIAKTWHAPARPFQQQRRSILPSSTSAITGLAMPNVEPPPSQNSSFSSGPNWKIILFWESTIAAPRATESMPSVTTKDGILT